MNEDLEEIMNAKINHHIALSKESGDSIIKSLDMIRDFLKKEHTQTGFNLIGLLFQIEKEAEKLKLGFLE